MPQSTLDAFIAPTASRGIVAEQHAMAPGCQSAACVGKEAPAPKGVPRVRVAGTSTVASVIEAAREQHPGARVFLVTLSWRHNHSCGADQVIVGCEARGAALDLRPPPRPKKGEPKEPPPTLGLEELCALINVSEEIADLLQDERAQVVVIDGYPQGRIYARFVACIAARCIKLRGESKRVTLPRATAPADATCKALLARFKKCRSVERLRAAASAYHEEELADRFP
ncbi:MAG: hypothetical protein CMD92_07095 [Gammaproteobacteria bacterium]|nr:hypothetical protein [Gammaproteobacteria bacterium]|tara:strand:+ start:965 stop:1645 length:681 start_codon:yes stop_codon:yes gene_type:complete